MMSQIRWHQPNAEANPLGHFNFIRWIVEWWNGRQMDRYISNELDKRFLEWKSHAGDMRHKSVIDLVLQAHLDRPEAQNSDTLDPNFRSFAIRQIRVFLFAGHDSTSSTICYAFHLLSQHREALSRLRAEHDAVFGIDISKTPSLLISNSTLLNHLPYTVAVIKETLRLFPPAASSREGKRQTWITSDTGTICPTDDVIMIWTLHVELHRHAKYWPHPDDFLPERWLVEPGHTLFPNKEAWRAFEHGPRNCIAQGLVMMELKVILAILARMINISDAYEEWDQLNPRTGKEVERIYRGQRAYQMEEAAAHPVEHYPCRVSFLGSWGQSYLGRQRVSWPIHASI